MGPGPPQSQQGERDYLGGFSHDADCQSPRAGRPLCHPNKRRYCFSFQGGVGCSPPLPPRLDQAGPRPVRTPARRTATPAPAAVWPPSSPPPSLPTRCCLITAWNRLERLGLEWGRDRLSSQTGEAEEPGEVAGGDRAMLPFACWPRDPGGTGEGQRGHLSLL